MSDYTVLVQIGLAMATIVTLMVLLVRIIAGGQPLDRDDRPRTRQDPWPLGVQEEEPVRWRFAALES